MDLPKKLRVARGVLPFGVSRTKSQENFRRKMKVSSEKIALHVTHLTPAVSDR